MITKGPKFVWGVPAEVKPIKGLPSGKTRLRLRSAEFAKVYVRTDTACLIFTVRDCGSHWEPGFSVGQNHRLAA